MKDAPIRIIVVDDHKLVRFSWKHLLQTNPRFQVIAECENGNIAIDQAEKLMPEIMLVDINMSPMNGFEVTEKIMKGFPSIKIIGMSVNNQPRYAMRMIRSGACGFFTKTTPLDEIIEGIMEVNKGKKYICKEIRNHLSPEQANEIG